MKSALLALFVLLLSAISGLAAEPDWASRRLGNLGVMLPTGDGWEVTKLEPENGWVSDRLRRTLSGDPMYLHSVRVFFHQYPKIFSDWLPAEVATDYLLWEIENMQLEGVDKGVFALPELDVYEEQHGAQTLHVLRNVKDYIEPWHPLLEFEAQELYLAFLPDFPETTTFYKIFISADCFFEGCTVDDLDLSEMTPLLDDLRDYSEASD